MSLSCTALSRNFYQNKSFCRGLGAHAQASCSTLVGSPTSSTIQKNLPLNPTVLVTGASRGIGRAIALELGKVGCRVIVNHSSALHHSASAADEVCKQITNECAKRGNGGSAVAMPADVADPQQVAQMFAQIRSTYGPIHVLVNNAGVTRDGLVIARQRSNSAESGSETNASFKNYHDVISTNLNGTYYCCHAALTGRANGSPSLKPTTGDVTPEVEQKGRTKATPALGMVDQRLGRIINIASVVGQIGNIGQVNYAASKGGVIALTRALAKEYGRRGITVNAVCPGYIADTGMTQMMSSQHSASSSSTKDSFTNGNSNPATPLTAVLPQIPLGRLGTPEEVAGLVTFLATHPAAAYMTGHCINIDGGIGIGAT